MARVFNVQIKKMFFDRAAVMDKVPPAKRKALSKIGAFIRQRARSRMRKRKKASAPGSPPSVHVGKLKDLLYFSYDPQAESVVVGPVKYREGEAPNLNEFGGTAQRRHWLRREKKFGGPKYAAKYPSRPFMAPALKESQGNAKLTDAWRDSIK
jgi:hypothetical protein